MAGSQEFELYGRPHGELFSQPRLLIPGIDVRIEFERASDSFCIQTSGTDAGTKQPQLIISEAKLIVTKHTIRNSLALNHAQLLHSGQNVIYPNRENEMRAYVIPKGQQQHTNETLLSGTLPDRLILVMINSEYVHGSYNSNPLCFEDFGISNYSYSKL